MLRVVGVFILIVFAYGLLMNSNPLCLPLAWAIIELTQN